MSQTYAEFLAKLEEVSGLLRQAFEEAVADITSTAQMTALQDAIASGDVGRVIAVLNLGPDFWAPLDRALVQVRDVGAIWHLSQLLPKTGSQAGLMQIRFDGRHYRAETWARTHGSRLVTEVSESVKEAVRVVVRDGLEAGRHPRVVALDIAGRMNRATNRREGGIVGLHSQQAGAVVRARAELETLDPAYFERKLRDRRFDPMVRKAIEAGKPLARADIERITARYADRLLKHRGDVIARTEGLRALNAGRHEGVAQLIERGDVPEEAVMLEWQATPDSRTRDTHRAMHKMRVRLGEPFVTPLGYRLMHPGDSDLGAPGSETIQCRCGTRTVVDWAMVARQAA